MSVGGGLPLGLPVPEVAIVRYSLPPLYLQTNKITSGLQIHTHHRTFDKHRKVWERDG